MFLFFSGLCMLSVHRKMVKERKTEIEDEVLRKFAENPRKLVL